MASLPKPAEEFSAKLAKATGLDVNVVRAWVFAEGAFTKRGTGYFNYLNVRPKPGGTSYSGVQLAGVSLGNFQRFRSVDDAVRETAYWINTMGNYAGIRAAIKAPGSESQRAGGQITAIVRSPWDAGHYGGGKALAQLWADFRLKGGPSFKGIAGLPGAHGGVVDDAKAKITGLGDVIGEKVLQGVILLVVLGLAAALFYTGTRRLSGDRLPSAKDLAQLRAAT